MEFRHLQQFLAVVDCGSIGKAARRLGISQPTLTRTIRSLERGLGTSLFTRSSDGSALNQFGRALERRARAIVIAADRVEREIGELVGTEQGRVVIATAPSFASVVLLPHVLPAFRASHPRIQVIVIEGIIDSALPRIEAGEIDFACGSVPTNFVPDRLVCEIVVPREPLMAIAGRDNPIASRRHVTADSGTSRLSIPR
jgi:DNA-binding transcriptional LysR family regulator